MQLDAAAARPDPSRSRVRYATSPHGGAPDTGPALAPGCIRDVGRSPPRGAVTVLTPRFGLMSAVQNARSCAGLQPSGLAQTRYRSVTSSPQGLSQRG